MGADHGAINIVEFPVQLASGISLDLHCREELRPDARPSPAVETAGHRTLWAIALGQIPPGSSSAQYPEDAIEDAAMLDGRSACLRFL
jgi:hypothetical protein